MTQEKKITFIISSLTSGGAENVCVNIANNFVNNGWQVDLVVLNLNNESYLHRVSKKINLIVLKVNHSRNSFFSLIKYLFKNKIKTVLVFNHELSVILVIIRAILRLKIKIISRNISLMSVKIKQFERDGFFKKYIVSSLIKFFYSKVDHVINQCHDMRNDLLSQYPQLLRNSSVIYNPTSKNIENYSKSVDFGKIKKKNYLLCVGRLEKVKAFHKAIEAFAGIASSFPNLRLKIVGEGNLEQKLKKKAKDLSIEDKVDFEGFQKDIIPYYLYAKATILTSIYDGYPNVLVESIALNTPVVAFNCKGGTKEIIQDGLNGYLAKDNDIIDLKNKLSKLLLRENNFYDLKNSIIKNKNETVISSYEELIASYI